MAKRKSDIGFLGLAVMGQNLVLNLERHGYAVSVYNRTAQTTRDFVSRHPGKRLSGYDSLPAFVASLERPRKLLLMVKTGSAVDEVVNDLVPLLEPGDLIADGGNSYFLDTERRARNLEAAKMRFMGVGISGGEAGALRGPSIMPGGERSAWEIMKPVFEAICAKVDGDPCVAYMGPRGAGHYVKMVHNGIEYAEMQLIAEAYDLMKRGLGMSNTELQRVFTGWNQSELASYLIEITGEILAKMDNESGGPLVDLILDQAEQKGTGKWTSQNALDLGVPVPTITAAVEARILSSYKKQRETASRIIAAPAFQAKAASKSPEDDVSQIRDALYASRICSYAQGMALLRAASQEYEYDFDRGEIARIWRGGCIIRAAILGRITKMLKSNPAVANLLLDKEFELDLAAKQNALRWTVKKAVSGGIPCPALSSALAYLDGYRSARLPANLIQAQRDYFGAHTYRRVDREGSFHTAWES